MLGAGGVKFICNENHHLSKKCVIIIVVAGEAVCPCGEIGIHVCLRSICRKTCWFKSSLGHHALTRVKSVVLLCAQLWVLILF